MNPKLRNLVGVIAVSGAVFPLMAAWPALASAQASPKTALTVKVTGARNAVGKIGVALFQNTEGFPTDTTKAIQGQDVAVDAKTLSSQVVFLDVPPGLYAVSVRHDENLNGKLDTNIFGIPKEGYGASNNPSKKLREPTFDEGKIELKDGEQVIEIKLIY